MAEVLEWRTVQFKAISTLKADAGLSRGSIFCIVVGVIGDNMWEYTNNIIATARRRIKLMLSSAYFFRYIETYLRPALCHNDIAVTYRIIYPKVDMGSADICFSI